MNKKCGWHPHHQNKTKKTDFEIVQVLMASTFYPSKILFRIDQGNRVRIWVLFNGISTSVDHLMPELLNCF